MRLITTKADLTVPATAGGPEDVQILPNRRFVLVRPRANFINFINRPNNIIFTNRGVNHG